MEEGEFQIEAFEQANVIVGGLFAVIALNFTLNADTACSAPLTTPCAAVHIELFGAGGKPAHQPDAVPVQLADALVWTLRAGTSLFFLSWAVPLLVLATALAFLLIAMA